MLTLNREVNERVIIDLRKFGAGVIVIMPLRAAGGVVRLGFDADAAIPIHREEVFVAIGQECHDDDADQPFT